MFAKEIRELKLKSKTKDVWIKHCLHAIIKNVFNIMFWRFYRRCRGCKSFKYLKIIRHLLCNILVIVVTNIKSIITCVWELIMCVFKQILMKYSQQHCCCVDSNVRGWCWWNNLCLNICKVVQGRLVWNLSVNFFEPLTNSWIHTIKHNFYFYSIVLFSDTDCLLHLIFLLKVYLLDSCLY